MTVAKNFLLLYLLLKPFYLFSSGGLQIADIFLMLSFATLVVVLKINPAIRGQFLETIKANKLFIIFVACTILVNGAYFIFYEEFRFLLSSLYFIFNLLAIITFTSFYKDKVFLERVSKVFKFNLLLQLAIFIIGIGRYYTLDRYMGTFNDPNQFGYYIFISFLFIYVINILLKKKQLNLLYLLITLVLIIQSASTGMILGIGGFLLLISAYHIYRYFNLTYEKLRKIIYTTALGLAVGLITILTVVTIPNNEKTFINHAYDESQAIIQRVTEKTDKASGDADMSLWEDRGYDIIFKYPMYIVFGAGEGGYDRFALAANNHNNEIHATLPSILFYYGIIPFLILSWWIYKKIKRIDPRILIALIALLIESFTLLNQRQSLFWMLVIIGTLSIGTITVGKHRSGNQQKAITI